LKPTKIEIRNEFAIDCDSPVKTAFFDDLKQVLFY